MNKKQMKLHYICNYTHDMKDGKLKVQPSGVNKISYVLSLLQKNEIDTTICSLAGSNLSSFIIKPRIEQINNKLRIIYPAVFSEKNILFKIIAKIWLQIYLLYYLFFKVRSNDKLLFYHSLQYKLPILILRLLRPKLNVFFEVEEIYKAAWGKSSSSIKKEIKSLRGASGYLFVNDFMNKKCNFNSDNNVVLYGDYRTSSSLQLNKPIDRKNHIVYAGVISKDSDVYLAISIMKYLPSEYTLSILGYGRDKEIDYLKKYLKVLKDINIHYVGVLYGEEYEKFLLTCKYGLCTRMLSDELSLYTYPSKVCSYMTNGVIPICPPLTILKESAISKNIIFSENLEPESIALTILENVDFDIDFNDLNDLDLKAVAKIKKLFHNENISN